MRTLLAVTATVASLFALGCPSKDTQGAGGATTPSSASSGASGPLATLESAPFANETWTAQDGQAMPFVFFAQQNVRVSAQCRQPNGQLACDAIRQLRNAPPVELSNSALNGGISAGTRVCQTLKRQLVSGRDGSGNEDGFCRFADGSMVSTGALEQYALQIK